MCVMAVVHNFSVIAPKRLKNIVKADHTHSSLTRKL